MSKYVYDSTEPVNVRLADLTDREQFLLRDSKTFCIYPWIHLHSYPTGETYPCFEYISLNKNNTVEPLYLELV